ncbi:hypothetical protein BU17DRAFT_81146 [Hysterangium stoloniferum]|nr:hypothetical protein BU17DRAFT_81146 [Hysterangium stoloniferum]
MHPVLTSQSAATFRPLPPLNVKQNIDWATECQTPLTANEDPNPSVSSTAGSKDNTASPSPGSDDGPNEPNTPPSRPSNTHQKPSFNTNGSYSWRSITDDLVKMQISESKPEQDVSSRYPIPTHLSFQPSAQAVHSRASSGDTSTASEVPAPPSAAGLQINTAVGSARTSQPFTAAPDFRPRSFQDGLDAERKRFQPITPVKAQVPAINTAVGSVDAQGPHTSPPRERFQSPQVQRVQAQEQQARYPSLQDQQPTYPSIQQGQFPPQSAQPYQNNNNGQQQAQGQQGHRPPPINVVHNPIDFRMTRADDEYMQPRIPNSTQFQQGGRVLSDNAGYPPYPSPHLPLGPPTPQLYDLALPNSPFRNAHQHSASDPAALAAAAGMNIGLREQVALMQGHLPTLHPFNLNVGGSPLPPHATMLYPPQFFPGQDAYAAAAAAMQGFVNRNQQQQQQQQQPPLSANSYGSPPGSATSQNGNPGGPSANNRKLGLYKTELCRSWEEKGSCRYGPKCQFAHGEDEIRKVARHPKYKTEICRTFWVSGSCPYGKRCCFIHTELPAPGVTPVAGSPPAETASGSSNPTSGTSASERARSGSVTSDVNESAPVSLLTRIQNQRTADAQAAVNAAANAGSTPTEGSATPTFQFPQQRPGALRVDTSTIDTQLSMKQNKSAYPYMNNQSFSKTGEHVQLISPGPVTAGPDLGRSIARFDSAYDRFNKAQTPTVAQQAPTNMQTATNNPLRHSFNGTESLNLQAQLSLATPPIPTKVSPPPNPAHSRSESATGNNNWNPGFSRSGLGGMPSNAGSPWSGELSVGANRMNVSNGSPGAQGSAAANANNVNERKWS